MTFEIVAVDLDERSYNIRIGTGLLDAADVLSEAIAGPDALIVTNDTVGPRYGDRISAALGDITHQIHSLPDGEQFKNLEHLSGIYDRLVEMRANRDTTVIALGGGVVGDMAGFAAATYQRGVKFLQVPTTLLAQVDSSVGGKTAVNHTAGKNLIGAFHQPASVIIDPATLATLPPRELSAGLAEVIKYGVLGDLDFLNWLEANISALVNQEPGPLIEAIKRCCTMKAAIVKADEREHGQRALLNLGHTFGHAIEATLGYGDWLHGEAVAAGMVMAARASGLPDESIERLQDLLSCAGLPVAPPPIGSDTMWAAMQLDKKVLNGRVRLVLLHELGNAYVSSDYDQAALQAALSLADG